MFSKVFINRPILASVISILIVLGGLVAYPRLPVERYPDITPPVVRVTANYPGASAKVLADTVAAPIEQEVNGVDNMLYMSGTCSNDGGYALDVTFAQGSDPDMCTVLTQNRVNIAMNKVPEDVRRLGITVKKRSPNLIMVLALVNDEAAGKAGKQSPPREPFDDLFLSNYIKNNIREVLARVRGVGDIQVLPEKDYAMRIWLDPEKLKARQLTTNDVVKAVREQNVQVAAGKIGQPPLSQNLPFQLTINTLGRLTSVKEFENIIIRTEPSERGARFTRIGDVARVEDGGKTYDIQSYLNGEQSATVLVYQAPGANAVEIVDELVRTMDRLQRDFPQGLAYKVVYDNSLFIKASLHEVQKTLYEAFVLVFLVVLLFLQNWRMTLIPMVTIPVALIGTFMMMLAFGFSANTLTLLGLVLAIGIVVDDAILVVENVERNMMTYHLTPREATLRAMAELFGPILAITLVLMSVFLPTAALPGISGQLYRQFAITIAVTTLFSMVNALTLSPALSALFLKPHGEAPPARLGLAGLLMRVIGGAVLGAGLYLALQLSVTPTVAMIVGGVMGVLMAVAPGVIWKPLVWLGQAFNWVFDACTKVYAGFTKLSSQGAVVTLVVFGLVLFLTYRSLMTVPQGFLPDDDQGMILIDIKLPDGASQSRTLAVREKLQTVIEEYSRENPGIIADVAMISGTSATSGNGPNNMVSYVVLTDWEQRAELHAPYQKVAQELARRSQTILEATIIPFGLPPIPGLGSTGGFEMRLQDRGGLGLETLQQVTTEVVSAANQQTNLRNVFSFFRATVPQLYLDIDREKVKNLDVPLQNVFETLQAYLGSTYINDFNKFSRTYQVMIQAEADFRSQIRDIVKLETRNGAGGMVPLGTFITVREVVGPDSIVRYNLYPAATINGSPAPGVSSGQSLDLMESLASATLPSGMGFEWSAMSYQEKLVSGQGSTVFVMALVVVYLLLAAQYESWFAPLSVVLSIPLAILGSMLTALWLGRDNNIFTQIGLVLLVALGAKNAILIVEFARANRSQGKSLISSAVEAARTRFRPILMTSFAFIMGVLPLCRAEGAGAASQQALGLSVVGGMVSNTLLGLLFTPALFVIIQWCAEKVSAKERPQPNETETATATATATDIATATASETEVGVEHHPG